MESWRNNCVTEPDDRKANVPKQALWDSFCTFMKNDMQVGKDLFLANLGKALSTVGYTEVQSVFQRGRVVSYNGIKTVKKTGAVTEVKKSKKRKTIIRIEDLQQWKETIVNEDKMTSFQSKTCGCIILALFRPVSFSLLGNILSKYPCWSAVSPINQVMLLLVGHVDSRNK